MFLLGYLGGCRGIGGASAHDDLLDDRARHHRIDHRRRRYPHVFARGKPTISSRRHHFFHLGRDPGSLHLLSAEDSFSPGRVLAHRRVTSYSDRMVTSRAHRATGLSSSRPWPPENDKATMKEAGRVLVGPVRTPRILAGPTAAWSVYGAAKVPASRARRCRSYSTAAPTCPATWRCRSGNPLLAGTNQESRTGMHPATSRRRILIRPCFLLFFEEPKLRR